MTNQSKLSYLLNAILTITSVSINAADIDANSEKFGDYIDAVYTKLREFLPNNTDKFLAVYAATLLTNAADSDNVIRLSDIAVFLSDKNYFSAADLLSVTIRDTLESLS